LFLGYDLNETRIIKFLVDSGYEVFHSNEVVESLDGFDLIVSFGYRHMIDSAKLNPSMNIVNIHLSYLPWNKGAHPNFWAHWDGTPSGVTIHKINEGLDTGNIIFQKIIKFEKNENTFALTYNKLFLEAEELFLFNFDSLLEKNYIEFEQRNKGSFHKVSDLPKDFSGWHTPIFEEIKRLEKSGFNPHKKYLDLIDAIESARSINNLNWMDLLRVVAKTSPSDLRKITKKIHEQDVEILNLFKQLAE
jgi:methionyl-tRNA formyltransferase